MFLSFWENGGPESFRKNRTVTIRLIGGPVPSAAVEHRIDAGHANPLQLWEQMGSPADPSAAQLAKLIRASEVVPEAVPITEDGCTVTLSPNSVVMVEFQ